MAKTEVNLQDAAKAEMEALVEQHNQLVQEISEANGRLAEVKQMIVEKQGYMKGLEDCEKQCKEK
jgi:prefoldin subunit 5